MPKKTDRSFPYFNNHVETPQRNPDARSQLLQLMGDMSGDLAEACEQANRLKELFTQYTELLSDRLSEYENTVNRPE